MGGEGNLSMNVTPFDDKLGKGFKFDDDKTQNDHSTSNSLLVINETYRWLWKIGKHSQLSMKLMSSIILMVLLQFIINYLLHSTLNAKNS